VRLDVREWVMMQTNKADKVKKSRMWIREELSRWRRRGVREGKGVETDARGYESLL
jgi:hypothetical protein